MLRIQYGTGLVKKLQEDFVNNEVEVCGKCDKNTKDRQLTLLRKFRIGPENLFT
jgi:hypothetical protein